LEQRSIIADLDHDTRSKAKRRTCHDIIARLGERSRDMRDRRQVL